MIVVFVSQCSKKAKRRTRRILDSFANRIGDNTWQTVVTEAGLTTIHKLLRATATKSTVVSCHRVRSRQRMQLVWVVGDRNKFNESGFVPVNSTKNNILHLEWENDWKCLNAIQIVSTLAALFHDIGKSSILFQKKLRGVKVQGGDPYRHEWISLQLFLHVIQGCTTDGEVFARLQNIPEELLNVRHIEPQKYTLEKVPAVARWISWLIVSHHRMPVIYRDYSENAVQSMRRPGNRKLSTSVDQFFNVLAPLPGWVRNQNSLGSERDNLMFDELVLNSPVLLKQISRFAKKAAADAVLSELSSSEFFAEPFLLHMSRLVLMVGDYNYSSLPIDDPRRVSGSLDWATKLVANTAFTDDGMVPKQALDEHLLGVASFCGQFSRQLPLLQRGIPGLVKEKNLAADTLVPRFKWQNTAVKQMRAIRESTVDNGLFVVNMASTGCGKTIANARMAYALGDPKQGARFTVALGLRTLTLQTGQSLREDLHLSDEKLSVLVGGSGTKQLFELNNSRAQNGTLPKQTPSELENYGDGLVGDLTGSESIESLVDDYLDTSCDATDVTDLRLGTLINDKTSMNLLVSPVVCCTIDHLIQASEHLRGGRYIIPTLRLLGSDLILDEPDDFSDSDLPALSRLVHLAGLFGSRVILSSATLQPDQVQGLFEGYIAGRRHYNKVFGKKKPLVECLWVDEHRTVADEVDNLDSFAAAHSKFVERRVGSLMNQPARRRGTIVPVKTGGSTVFSPVKLVDNLVPAILDLHEKNHDEFVDKSVSIGLLRMANIDPLLKVARSMFATNIIPDDTHIHLCVYHARQVLLLRNELEVKLDAILDRKNGSRPTDNPEVYEAIKRYDGRKNHVFVVLASPVAEVGRDHDYDWAMAEPSSMRSLIQLAGRVRRHRHDAITEYPNIAIWETNVRGLRNDEICFKHPGYENKGLRLESHDLTEILDEDFLTRVDATKRIQKPQVLKPNHNFNHLEHQCLQQLMANQRMSIVNSYWNHSTANKLHTHLVRISQFRAGDPQLQYLAVPGMERGGTRFYLKEQFVQFGEDAVQAAGIESGVTPESSDAISAWLNYDLELLVRQMEERMDSSRAHVVKNFCGFTLPVHRDRRMQFTEYLGFENY